VCGQAQSELRFGLINEFRRIAEALSVENAEELSMLCELWRNSLEGIEYVGHELFIKRVVQCFTPRIDWMSIEAAAQVRFPHEYVGVMPRVDGKWCKSDATGY
jgi:hypothetical protein